MVANERKKKTLSDQNSMKTSKLIFYLCVVILPCIQFCIFYVGVNFNSVLLAFEKYDFSSGSYSFLTGSEFFDNFKDFFKDMSSYGTRMFKNSFNVYFYKLLFGTGLAILFSYYIYKNRTGSGFFRVVLFLPSMLSSIILTVMYLYFVEDALPVFLETFGMTINDPFKLETELTWIIVFNIWIGFGSSMLLYVGSMSGISEEIIESAQLEGITPIKELFYIVLPMIYPTFVTLMIIGIANLFVDQANIYNFDGPYAEAQVWTFGYYLFTRVMGTNSSLATYPMASAAGIVLTLVAVPLTYLIKWSLEKFGPSED